MTMTRDEVIAEAGRRWAAACARKAALSPREAAVEAYRPGGPTVDQLEHLIRVERGLTTHGRRPAA